MKVLIACEESQEVAKAFRQRGHEAYSCDIQESSGGHPEWHIRGNCIPIIGGGTTFQTEDGKEHEIDGLWDLIIAHPPCTYLTATGNRWFSEDRYGPRAKGRYLDRIDAIRFFMEFVVCGAKKIAIENPIGIMSGVYRKPDQIIQPFWFGDAAKKSTCLWLKNLPKLRATNIVDPGEKDKYGASINASASYARDKNGKILRWNDPLTAKIRSKTYHGIAEAMAEQWGTEKPEGQRCENCQHWISWDWSCHKSGEPTRPIDACGDWERMDPERDLMQTFSP